ncbi:MAG TPA: hypothetical protein VHP36_08670 [Chitinispirillaceae bacterium]|nr:hypothetical protein [Chitinispirillaceae bacterium]
MEVRLFCPALLLIYSLVSANLQEPFPLGFSMGNQGTVLWENAAQGHQPWISAAFCDNSRKFGLACGAVSYYDRMDNYEDELIYKAFGGTFWAFKKIRLKLAISHFSALGIYYEQSGFLSAGFDLFTHLRAAIEITGTRSGLTGFEDAKHNIAECGFSAWVPFKITAIQLSISHIPLKTRKTHEVDAPVIIRNGFHTLSNRFGAQGIIIQTTPSHSHPLRFILGEQYRFLKYFAIEASLANNPLLIGVGVLIEMAPINASVSLVNHPVLGWSRGFTAMY